MTDKPTLWTPDELRKAKREPDLVTVPARVVLALDGAGGPEKPAFAAAVGALYGVSYGLRFARKKAGRAAFKVGVLEGLWGAEGEDLPADGVPDRESWRWQVRMAVPDDVTEEELAALVEQVTTKRRGKLEGSEEARAIQLVRLPETRMARILHVGPFADEPASFAKIADLLAERGLTRELEHLEVYLSDPRRTEPARLRTALLVEIVG